MSASAEELSAQAEQLKDITALFKINGGRETEDIRKKTEEKIEKKESENNDTISQLQNLKTLKIENEKGYNLDLSDNNSDNEFEKF